MWEAPRLAWRSPDPASTLQYGTSWGRLRLSVSAGSAVRSSPCRRDVLGNPCGTGPGESVRPKASSLTTRCTRRHLSLRSARSVRCAVKVPPVSTTIKPQGESVSCHHIKNMTQEVTRAIIEELWVERNSIPFPLGLGGKDVNGIDFDMLDADVAGCVMVYLEQGNSDVRRTTILALCYRNCEYVIPILNEEAAAYYWRLGRLAELILKEIAKAERPTT